MAIQFQNRRGTTSENDAFTGAAGEISVDTTKNNIRIHDGATAGGHEFNNADNTFTGLKNALINGDFGVNQYADIDTAPVAMVHTEYGIDRFNDYLVGVTGTKQRFANQLVNGRYVNTVKCIATSTASGRIGLQQRIEVFYNSETKTFGAWVKSDSVYAQAVVNDGVTSTFSTAHTGGGDWEFLSFPKTIASNATFLWCYAVIVAIDSLANVSITTGDYIESTMWQLESGTVATPFEQQKYGNVLADCQRYLPYRSKTGKNNKIHGSGYANTTNTAVIALDVKSSFRTEPTVVNENGNFILRGNGGNYAVTAPLTISTTTGDESTIVVLATVASGLVVDETYILMNANDATAYIEIPTEL